MRKLSAGSCMSRSEMTKQKKKEKKNARETSNVCPRKFALKDYNFPLSRITKARYWIYGKISTIFKDVFFKFITVSRIQFRDRFDSDQQSK